MSSLFSVPTIASVGISFSDTAIRCIKFVRRNNKHVPVVHVEFVLPEGAITDGRITDAAQVTSALVRMRTQCQLHYIALVVPTSVVELAHVAIPHDTRDTTGALRTILAERTSIDVSDSIIGYQIVSSTPKALMAQVSIVPQTIAKEYLRVCLAAGLMPLLFEYEGQALARALLEGAKGTALIAAINTDHTSLIITHEGHVVGHKIVSLGTETFIKLLIKERNIDAKEAVRLLEHEGVARSALDTTEILINRVDELKDAIEHYYISWSERYASATPLGEVIVTGAVIPGLVEYLSAGMRTKVIEGNPWRHCLSFDEAIPELTHHDAQRYAAAIGVTLPAPSHINLLPVIQRKLIKRTRQMKRFFAILGIVGVVAIAVLGALVIVQR